ncbi:MAG: ATP-binding cassette domain-containing protein [Collinsella sp.]|nr:ATP-binding cassette domain-containing protein [Collinsella sp.]
MNKPLEQMFRLHGVRGWRLFCAHTWHEVLPFVLSCARAVIGMSWKAGVAAELIGMAAGTVGERIYQAKLLIETADLLAWTVLVVAASWACERVLVWLLRVSGPVAWHAAVRAHGHGLRGRAGAASDGTAAELALAVGDRAPWAPALDGLVLHVPAGGRTCVMGASGVGKSTLLALVAGECAPCSMVFQDARLAESASALDNVLVCADARVDASSAAALLRLLVPGIDVHARVAKLSGGQRRRVEIARALLRPGGAVILDEPFTGLDTAARDACAEAVLDLLDGRMLLLATHDAADAQALNISDIITL